MNIQICNLYYRRRISLLDHLERMEEDRMPKKIFTQELEGARRRGRPRKRWKEEAERDLQMLGVRRWRELVADKKKWKDRPKPTVGCSANGRRRRITFTTVIETKYNYHCGHYTNANHVNTCIPFENFVQGFMFCYSEF